MSYNGHSTSALDARASALSQDLSFGGSLLNSLRNFWSQYLALVIKNLRLAVRNWKATVGLLLAPILVVVFLVRTYFPVV